MGSSFHSQELNPGHCHGNAKSFPLDHRGIPYGDFCLFVLFCFVLILLENILGIVSVLVFPLYLKKRF